MDNSSSNSTGKDRYEIIESIKPGGMGTAFRGYDKNLQRIVVIKTINSDKQNQQFINLIRDEARNQAKLTHPNIAQVFDFYEVDGLGHIVMELVEGTPLFNAEPSVVKPDANSLDEVLEIFEQIIKGFRYAHSHGVIHRDISPNNIMYSPTTKIVKIIDFGMSKMKEATQRDYSILGGTPGFIAPERIINLNSTNEEKYDIYSLGVILYIVLTGEHPYPSGFDLSKPAPHVSDYRDDINEDIDEQIWSMIQIMPESRVATLDALLAAIRRQRALRFRGAVSVPIPHYEHRVRDPIHGYIAFSHEERQIVNHCAFQRLRNIRQLSTTYLTYPGATHDRFSHSLGVMHVATRVFDQIVQKNISMLSWDNDYVRKQRQMLRLVALLHDIGHAPFSHVADTLFPPEVPSHERMSSYLIRNTELAHLIDELGDKNGGFNHREIAGLIEGKHISDYSLIKKIFAGQLDADKMDYLLRDSRMAGVSYGNYDIEHLIRSMTLHAEDVEIELAVEQTGIHALEALILARYFMFVQVYFHKTRRVYDKILEHIMHTYLPNHQIPIPEFLEFDDSRVLEYIRINRNEDEWCRMYYNRSHPKLIFEIFPHAESSEREKASKIRNALLDKGFPRHKLIIDGGFTQPPILFTDEENRPLFKILDNKRNIHTVHRLSRVLTDLIKPIYLFRVYASSDIQDQVKSIIREIEK